MSALLFLIDTFSRLYLMAFLLRIILQLVRADFYNPISQFIVRVTNPLVVPARRLIPSSRGFDLPTAVVLVILQAIVTLIIFALTMRGVPGIAVLIWATFFRLIALAIGTYLICILMYVILSWVAQANYSPFAMFLGQIVEPVLRPARRLIPPIGGLDISPLIVMILLMALSYLLQDLMALLT